MHVTDDRMGRFWAMDSHTFDMLRAGSRLSFRGGAPYRLGAAALSVWRPAPCSPSPCAASPRCALVPPPHMLRSKVLRRVTALSVSI